MDIDDLRKDFDRFREEGGFDDRGLRPFGGGIEVPIPPPPVRVWSDSKGEGGPPDREPMPLGEDVREVTSPDVPGGPPGSDFFTDGPQEQAGDRVVYHPGMTMEEMEKEAILLALKDVGGNRRKAAERLEIGERTLYRKIKKYGLEE
jgi:hypothetical protein